MNEFAAKELKQIDYNCPLDVANLFSEKMLNYTLNHIFAKFIDATNEARENCLEYSEPIVFSEKFGVFNIDYSFIIGCLSDLVSTRKMFLLDFELNFEETKNAEFLIANVLEDMCNLVKMNNKTMNCIGRKEITYRPSFIKQIVIGYKHYVDGSDRFIQMNSVAFKLSEIKKILNEDIFDALRVTCDMSSFKIRTDIFGRKACAKFWVDLKAEPRYFSVSGKN